MALQPVTNGQTISVANIDQQIRLATNQLNGYQKSKNGYTTSLNYAKKMLSGLNESLKYLNTSNDNLRKTFTISGKTADAGNIEKVKDEVSAAIREVNNMISSMNSVIKELSNAIYAKQNEINKLKRKRAQQMG